MSWKIIDTGVHSAIENMRIDEDLLLSSEGEPILHFYDWKQPSLTYGYFVRPEDFLDMKAVRALGIDVARRPTGGGIVFHLWDFAFSAIVPSSCPEFSFNTLKNYRLINDAVQKAVQRFSVIEPMLMPRDAHAFDDACSHFCMAKPTKYDVIWKEKKIAGAAQRKTKQGFLHQGTISLIPPNIDMLQQMLKPGTEVLRAMQTYTHALLEKGASLKEIKGAKNFLAKELVAHLSRR